MPDPIFENPRLVAIYDALDGSRRDLDHYLALTKELKVKSILDIGCGTGCFACLASEQGFEVTGLEPAKASLDFARDKPNADKVRWILGDASQLPPMAVDLAVITGNVAQVFVTDEAWNANLMAIRNALQPKGHLIFEVRNPAKKARLEWTREKTFQRTDIPGTGMVEGWCEVTDLSKEVVSFRWTYIFASDGAVMTSDSTLRFRDKEAIEASLAQ